MGASSILPVLRFLRSKKLETVPGAGTLPVGGTGGRSAPGRRRHNPATSVEHDFVQFQRGFEDGVDLLDEGLEMRSLHVGVEGGVVFPGFDE